MTDKPYSTDPYDLAIDFQLWRTLLEESGDHEGLDAVDIQCMCLDLMAALSLDVKSVELQDQVLLQNDLVLSFVVNRFGDCEIPHSAFVSCDELVGEDKQLAKDFLAKLNTIMAPLLGARFPLLRRSFEFNNDLANVFYRFSRQTPHRKAGDILADRYDKWTALREKQSIERKTPPCCAPGDRRRI